MGQLREQCLHDAQFSKSDPCANAIAQSSRCVSIFNRLNLFVRPNRAPSGQTNRQNGRFIMPIRTTIATSITILMPKIAVKKRIPSA
jgi:hypothetical protein